MRIDMISHCHQNFNSDYPLLCAYCSEFHRQSKMIMKYDLKKICLSWLLCKPALLVATLSLFAANRNLLAEEEGWEEVPISAAPEVGTWMIGFGVLAILVFGFLRRRRESHGAQR